MRYVPPIICFISESELPVTEKIRFLFISALSLPTGLHEVQVQNIKRSVSHHSYYYPLLSILMLSFEGEKRTDAQSLLSSGSATSPILSYSYFEEDKPEDSIHSLQCSAETVTLQDEASTAQDEIFELTSQLCALNNIVYTLPKYTLDSKIRFEAL